MWSIPSYLLLWTQALNFGIVFEWLTLMFCVKQYLAKFSEPLKYSWLQSLLKRVMPNTTFIPSLTTTFSYTPVDHWTLSCSSRSLREPNTGSCFLSLKLCSVARLGDHWMDVEGRDRSLVSVLFQVFDEVCVGVSCMYICMYYVCMYYVCVYVCMYVCIIYVCMYECMYICLCIMYVCIMYVCMYVCVHVCMYVCTYVCMYMCVLFMYVCVY